jgi:hypothetical protein
MLVYDRLEESLRKLCNPAVTPQQTSEFFFNSISQVVSDAIDLGCGQYSSKEACDRKNKQAMKLFRSPQFDPASRIDFLTPLLEIAKRIS